MEELCRICGEVLNEDNGHVIIKVSQEHAVENIRKSAELRGLEWSCLANKGDRFHVDCRKEFTKNDKIKTVRVLQNSKPKTRNDSNPGTPLSTTGKFDYRTCCLFCTKAVCIKHVDDNGHCIIKSKKHLIGDVSFVRSKTWFDASFHRQVKGHTDDWSCEVRGRIETVSSLQAQEAVYHRRCLQLLSLQRDRPTCGRESDEATPAKKKRDINLETDPRSAVFFKVIEFLKESDEEHLTMKQCQDKIKEFTDKPYSRKWFKSRLMQYYGDSVIIAGRGGCQNVFYFKDHAKHLLYEFYRQRRLEQGDDEKARVIKLAAELIRSDIKDLTD